MIDDVAVEDRRRPVAIRTPHVHGTSSITFESTFSAETLQKIAAALYAAVDDSQSLKENSSPEVFLAANILWKMHRRGAPQRCRCAVCLGPRCGTCIECLDRFNRNARHKKCKRKTLLCLARRHGMSRKYT